MVFFDRSGSLRDWVPLHPSEVDGEIQRIKQIHSSKNMKNYYKQQELAQRRMLDKMTTQLNVRENQNINILKRVGPSNVRPGVVGAAFFHKNNLLEMPLRRQNVLNFPYVHKPPRPGPINARIFQRRNIAGTIPSNQKIINVINDPTKIKTSITTLPGNKIRL